MRQFLRSYRNTPWPKLEITPLRRSQKRKLILFTIVLIAGGWLIWFSGSISAEKFLLLGLSIPILFFLKSRFVTIVGLLTFQVLLGFVFIGNSDYALLFVLALIGAIVAFENPIFMYIFLIVAVWFDTSPMGFGHPLRMEVIVGAGLLIGWLFKEVLQPRTESRNLVFPEFWPALILLLWAGFGYIIWCPEQVPFALRQLKSFTAEILFFIISPLIISTVRKLDWAIAAWIGIGVFAAFFTFFGPMLGYQPPEASGWGEAYGAFGTHKNWSASLMSLSFFMILGAYYWSKGSFDKIVLAFILVLIIAALLYQGSKGAAVGLGIGFVIFWTADTLFNRFHRAARRILLRFLLIVGSMAIFLIAVYMMNAGQLMGSYYFLFYSPFGSPTWVARLELWEIAFNMIQNEGHLFRGLGLGAFASIGIEYGLPSEIAKSSYPHPHNLFLDTYLHLGLPGLLLFGWIAISVLLKLWRGFIRFTDAKYYYLCLGLFCSFIGFYLHCLIDFEINHVIPLWLYLGMAVGIVNIAKNAELSDLSVWKERGFA